MVVHTIPKEIFRAYDIRGIVGETLTLDTVREIGQAIGTKVLEIGQEVIAVGRDGRLSGDDLNHALCQGILSSGCNVIDIGQVPTPLLYFATHYLALSSGVMITGSHNPANYNGLKIIIGGQALYGEEITHLYQMVINKAYKTGCGQKSSQDLIQPYIDKITKDIKLNKSLKIVVDCGNGVAGGIAPLLYRSLGCEVISLYCEIDGNFPNHHPDPGQPENLIDLIAAVKIHKADLGLAFDGDGDRLGIVDDKGNIIWPDRQLILFSKYLLEANPKAKIIFDVKCTRHVKPSIKSYGGEPIMWKTGHSFIKAKMKEVGALLAGEMSGHLFFKDRWFGFDDGLYAGARMLEILSVEKESAFEIFSQLPNSFNTPELLLGVPEHEKFEVVKELIALAQFNNAETSTIDGLRVDFEDGFGLVRPSNTGPNLILRFEGNTESALERIQSEFRRLLLAIRPQWVLPF